MPITIKDALFREITDVEEKRILSPKIIECLRTKGIRADEGEFSFAGREGGEYYVEGDGLGIYGYDDKSAKLFYAAIVQCADIIAAEVPMSEHLGMPPPGESTRKKPAAKGGRRTRRRPADKGTRRR